MPKNRKIVLTEVEEALATSGWNVSEILKIERRYLFPSVTHYYEEPALLVRGEGAEIVDSEGRRYIDLFGGVCTVWAGHGRSEIADAVNRQVRLLNHVSTLYPTIPAALYARKLASHAPGKISKFYFTNSGSEANELALFLARKYQKNHSVVVLNNSYHGRTSSTAGATMMNTWRNQLNISGKYIPVPDCYCYRCSFGKNPETCGLECVSYASTVLKCQSSGRVAAIIAEPIQGLGGIIVPGNPDYFKALKEVIDNYDGLFISDEVQTGFGRTGTGMWGISHWGVKPDIITMAKSMANGFPIGCVGAVPWIADCLEPRDTFHTFSSNPVSCIAALATLELIEKEDFIAQAERKGRIFQKRLDEMREKRKLIGEHRGLGLIRGVELVRDRRKKNPATKETLAVMERAKEKGLLIGRGGIDGNVLRIQPPAVLTKEQIENAMDILEEALKEVEKSR